MGKKSQLAPIVLFTYNRLEHIKKVITAIHEAKLGKESNLFIVSDGPKNQEDEIKINAIRSYLKEQEWFDRVELFAKERNVGFNIFPEVISKLLKRYDRLIVLEDDIEIGEDTLVYFNESLEHFKENKEVFQISAFIEPIDPEGLPDYSLINMVSGWGWATWRDRWEQNIDDGYEILQQLYAQDEIYNRVFPLPFNPISDVINFVEGSLDTWDALWAVSIYIKNGKVLTPNISFVKNIGHDDSGTNCGDTELYNIDKVKKYISIDKPKIGYSELLEYRKADFLLSELPTDSFRTKLKGALVETIKSFLINFMSSEKKMIYKVNRLRRFEKYTFSYLNKSFTLIDKESFLDDNKLFVHNEYISVMDLGSENIVDLFPNEGVGIKVLAHKNKHLSFTVGLTEVHNESILKDNLKSLEVNYTKTNEVEPIIQGMNGIALMKVSNKKDALAILLKNIDKVENFIIHFCLFKHQYRQLANTLEALKKDFVLKFEDYGIEEDQFFRTKYKKNTSFTLIGSRV